MNKNQNSVVLSRNFAERNAMAQALVQSKVFHPLAGVCAALACVALALPTIDLATRIAILVACLAVVTPLAILRRRVLGETSTGFQRGSSAFMAPGYAVLMTALLATAALLPNPTVADAAFLAPLAFVTTVVLGRHYDLALRDAH